VMNNIFTRTSIRKFTNQVVEHEKIEEILRAGMFAPSAGNQQPWEFYVVTNKKLIEQLAAVHIYSTPTGNAPVAIVPCYRLDGIYPQYAQIDLAACVQNMLLQADALELGSVWIGIAPEKERMQKVREILNLPEHLTAFAIVPVGYPLEEKPQQQDRFEKKRIHYLD